MNFDDLDYGTSTAWSDAMSDPFLGASPWYIARHAPPARIVQEARSLSAAAAQCMEREPPWDLSARALVRMSDACWLATFVAWMEGR